MKEGLNSDNSCASKVRRVAERTPVGMNDVAKWTARLFGLEHENRLYKVCRNGLEKKAEIIICGQSR